MSCGPACTWGERGGRVPCPLPPPLHLNHTTRAQAKCPGLRDRACGCPQRVPRGLHARGHHAGAGGGHPDPSQEEHASCWMALDNASPRGPAGSAAPPPRAAGCEHGRSIAAPLATASRSADPPNTCTRLPSLPLLRDPAGSQSSEEAGGRPAAGKLTPDAAPSAPSRRGGAHGGLPGSGGLGDGCSQPLSHPRETIAGEDSLLFKNKPKLTNKKYRNM